MGVYKKKLNTPKSINIWIWFYVLCMILSSYSVYMIYLPITPIVHIIMFSISALTIYLFIDDGIEARAFFIPLITMVLFSAASLFTTTDTVSTIFLCLRFLVIIYCTSIFYHRNIDLFRTIYQCLYFLMVLYFCFYVLFDILAPNLGLLYIKNDFIDLNGMPSYSIYENHYNIYFRWATSVSFGGITIKRMSGFCWEPGQYQIYLNFVLMYLLFFEKTAQKKTLKIVFTLINIILCGSSMGYLISVIFLMIVLIRQKNKILRTLCFVPLIVAGGIIIIYIIKTKSISAVYSYTNRTAELGLIFDILFRNNILGASNISSNGSNGLIRFLWAYGYLAIIAVILIGICIYKNKSLIKQYNRKIAFSIWLLFSLFNEPIEYFNFTFLIISIIITDSQSKKKKGKIEVYQNC